MVTNAIQQTTIAKSALNFFIFQFTQLWVYGDIMFRSQVSSISCAGCWLYVCNNSFRSSRVLISSGFLSWRQRLIPGKRNATPMQYHTVFLARTIILPNKNYYCGNGHCNTLLPLNFFATFCAR
jgi:hypothetical protein